MAVLLALPSLAPVAAPSGGPSIWAALNVNLLAWWKLDEASGARGDASGNGYTLTDHNGTTQTPGKLGSSAHFATASSQWLDSTTSTFALTGDLTIATWVYPDSLSGAATYGRGILAYQSSFVQGDFIVGVMADGRVTCYHFRDLLAADPTGRHTTSSTGLVPISAWSHIVFRRASGTYTIWVNGVSYAFSNATTEGGWGSGKLQMSRAYNTSDTSYYWNGRIDETAVWSRALTDSEIATIYASGVGVTHP